MCVRRGLAAGGAVPPPPERADEWALQSVLRAVALRGSSRRWRRSRPPRPSPGRLDHRYGRPSKRPCRAGCAGHENAFAGRPPPSDAARGRSRRPLMRTARALATDELGGWSTPSRRRPASGRERSTASGCVAATAEPTAIVSVAATKTAAAEPAAGPAGRAHPVRLVGAPQPLDDGSHVRHRTACGELDEMLSERRGVEQAHHMSPAGRRVVRCDDAGKDPVCGMRVELDVRHLTPHIALAPICVTPNLRGCQPVGSDGAAAPLPLALPFALPGGVGPWCRRRVALPLPWPVALALPLADAIAVGRTRSRCRSRSRARWPCRCRCCCLTGAGRRVRLVLAESFAVARSGRAAAIRGLTVAGLAVAAAGASRRPGTAVGALRLALARRRTGVAVRAAASGLVLAGGAVRSAARRTAIVPGGAAVLLIVSRTAGGSRAPRRRRGAAPLTRRPVPGRAAHRRPRDPRSR